MSIVHGASQQHGRIVTEVERCIQMLHVILDTLEGEIAFAQNSKQPGIPFGALKQMKEACACLNSLTDSKIRLDKSAKLLADAMTPVEEMAAVQSYIRGLDSKERFLLLAEFQS